MLDLMVACWSENPAKRPSARDIHRLSSSLEFRHFMDVIELGKQEIQQDRHSLSAVSYRDGSFLCFSF